MKRKLNEKVLRSSRTIREAGALLGKQHEYKGTSNPNISRIARNIGFSPKEISELERIYQTRSKEPKKEFQ